MALLRVAPPPPAVPAARRRSALLRWPLPPGAARRWRRSVCGGCRGHLAARAAALVPPAPRASPRSLCRVGGGAGAPSCAGGAWSSWVVSFGFGGPFPFLLPARPRRLRGLRPPPPFPRWAAPAAWAALAPGFCLRVRLSLWGSAAPPGAGRLTRCRGFGIRGLDRLDCQSLLKRLGKVRGGWEGRARVNVLRACGTRSLSE